MIDRKKGFVCQNCGKNVPPRTDRCPHCGRFFKGVRCPQCHYVGVADDFLKGCPSCGYLASEENQGEKGAAGFFLHESGRKPGKDLPAWFYFSALALLSLAVIALVAVFINMN